MLAGRESGTGSGGAQRDDAAVASRDVLVLQLRGVHRPRRAPPTAATAAGKPHGCAELPRVGGEQQGARSLGCRLGWVATGAALGGSSK